MKLDQILQILGKGKGRTIFYLGMDNKNHALVSVRSTSYYSEPQSFDNLLPTSLEVDETIPGIHSMQTDESQQMGNFKITSNANDNDHDNDPSNDTKFPFSRQPFKCLTPAASTGKEQKGRIRKGNQCA